MSWFTADFDFTITGIGFVHLESVFAHRGTIQGGSGRRNEAVLALVVSGNADYEVLGMKLTVEPGDILFFPGHVLRSFTNRDRQPWVHYVVNFCIQFANEAMEEAFFGMKHVIKIPYNGLFAASFQKLHHEWTAKNPGYLLYCKSEIMSMFCTLVRQLSYGQGYIRHTSMVYEAMNYIVTHYSESVTAEQLSRQAGVSVSHLQKLFKKITGESIIEYRNRIKIHLAKDMLSSGQCNVSEAAKHVGFQDIYYFSRLFKKVIGHSPSECIGRPGPGHESPSG